jgi:hypothetical protein
MARLSPIIHESGFLSRGKGKTRSWVMGDGKTNNQEKGGGTADEGPMDEGMRGARDEGPLLIPGKGVEADAGVEAILTGFNVNGHIHLGHTLLVNHIADLGAAKISAGFRRDFIR